MAKRGAILDPTYFSQFCPTFELCFTLVFSTLTTRKHSMSKPIHPLALFRLSVLGPLASRDHLERGELKQIIRELASKTYQIPGSKRMHLSASIIERWYYLWLGDGIEALSPKPRQDKH